MISWIKGETIEIWENGIRVGVVISCSGVGYEVQVLSRDLEVLKQSKVLILWIHQIQKEDGSKKPIKN